MGDDLNFTARSSSSIMDSAKLTLQRIQMQATASAQKNDVAQPGQSALGLAAKGKPRLLLMGQRRYVSFFEAPE